MAKRLPMRIGDQRRELDAGERRRVAANSWPAAAFTVRTWPSGVVTSTASLMPLSTASR